MSPQVRQLDNITTLYLPVPVAMSCWPVTIMSHYGWMIKHQLDCSSQCRLTTSTWRAERTWCSWIASPVDRM